MKTILVTGGSGMIGKNLQDLINSCKESCNNNTEFLWLFPRSSELDLLSNESIDKYFFENKIDFIVHLAANVGGLFKNLKYKVEMFRENIIMNENILFYANKYNIKNGIFCCSTCIFPANPSKYPMTEEMLMEGYPHDSNASYGYAKRLMYFQCQNYNKQYNRKYICITPCNIYGKYDNFDLNNSHVVAGLIHKFHLASISDEILTIKTGLNSMRQLINAIDISKIIKNMILNFDSIDYSNIILADDDIFIVDLIKIISKKFPAVKYEIINDEQGQGKKTCSNELFKSKYPNYEFINIEFGVFDTIEWFLLNYQDIRK
jgi:GDP-L-fucose synthase